VLLSPKGTWSSFSYIGNASAHITNGTQTSSTRTTHHPVEKPCLIQCVEAGLGGIGAHEDLQGTG